MKVHYFDIYGKAEAHRMLLTHAKVEFTDNRINNEQLAKLKEEGVCEFG